MTKKQRLELTWVGKERRPRLEPRILIEKKEKSYHAASRAKGDLFDNRLIQGDNLLALKALESEFAGRVDCVVIDPPYNTGSAFTHYNDGLEHSIWLSMMRDRIESIYNLLSKDGSLWVILDDNEFHYFKVMCDEIFGRKNFIITIVWENFYGRSNAAAISPSHNYILIYSKAGQDWKNIRNLLPREGAADEKYSNPDDDPRGRWRLGPIFAPEERHEGLMYAITTPSGRIVKPPRGSHWRMIEAEFWRLHKEGRVTFGKSGDNNPALKIYLNEVQAGVVPRTWWPHTEVGHSQEAKREIQILFPELKPFDTPKPERLLARIIQIATNPGDLILDSFAGSGTTGAVAHKMGRRWIMVELGAHAITHIIPRIKAVIDGHDPGGVTTVLRWRGGGGFYFYNLAPSLLRQDRYGQWVISPDYNPEMLAEAVCKVMGYTYAPSLDATSYWRHGHSTETDFIFVTTQAMTYEALAKLSNEVGDERTLLVACRAYAAKDDSFPNLTVKKIPLAVLARCEWGRDDYSHKLSNASVSGQDTDETTLDEVKPVLGKARRGPHRATQVDAPSLFGEGT